jgi:hypothetical protein
MSESSGGSVPGFQAKQDAQAGQVTWSGRHGQDLTATRKVVIAAASVDVGNTPQTTLRSGLVMAIKTSDGKAYPFDARTNDGRQIAIGVLEQSQDMLEDGVATDRFTQILVQGLVRESRLVGLNPRAKTQLAGRFLFDSDIAGSNAVLMQPRNVTRVFADTTVTRADHGKLFIATSGVTFTLPDKEDGLAFRFMQANDQPLRVASTSDILYRGTATGSLLQFDTSSQRVGSQVLVECGYTGENSLKWIVTNLGGTTATIS